MQTLILLLEIALFASALCLVHSLKPRLGLVPLYALLGTLEAVLFFAGKGDGVIMAEYFLAPPGRYGSMVFVPLILSLMVLVYDLEGTQAVRRLIVALVVIYVFHGAFDVVLHYHATHPPPGVATLEGQVLIEYSIHERLASLGAFLVDIVVIIVTYQFLSNRLPWCPRELILFVGLVLAMISDAFGFLTFYGKILDGLPSLDVVEKVQSGVAAAVPVAMYIRWYRWRWPERLEPRERHALELLDLRARVQEAEVLLAVQQARFEQMKAHFRRYVSPEIVDLLASDPGRIRLGGQSMEVTVLFADLQGYSTLSELLEPSEIIDLLNSYFGRVGDEILNHRGMINEFEGDAVLAVFGAPLPLEDHGIRGLLTALDIVSALEELNQAWDEDGTSRKWKEAGMGELAVRLGIHSGQVVAGNLGNLERMKYAIIGDTVNLASRVEGLNKVLDTSLLFTKATLDALGHVGLDLPKQDHGHHQVRGRSEEVHVYTINPEDYDSARLVLSEALTDTAASTSRRMARLFSEDQG